MTNKNYKWLEYTRHTYRILQPAQKYSEMRIEFNKIHDCTVVRMDMIDVSNPDMRIELEFGLTAYIKDEDFLALLTDGAFGIAYSVGAGGWSFAMRRPNNIIECHQSEFGEEEWFTKEKAPSQVEYVPFVDGNGFTSVNLTDSDPYYIAHHDQDNIYKVSQSDVTAHPKRSIHLLDLPADIG